MKQSWFAGLVILIISLAVTSWWIKGKRDPDIPERLGKLVFADLDEKLNHVTQLSISSENRQLVIERDEKQIWRVPAMDGYAAKPGLIREILLGLSDLAFLEPRTRKAELFSQLGLDNPDKPGSTVRLLKLTDIDGIPLAELFIGIRGPELGNKGDSIYIRLPNEDQAWLAEGFIDPPSQALGWVEKEIIHVSEDRIQSIVIEGPANNPIRIKRSSAAQLNKNPQESNSQNPVWLLENRLPPKAEIDYSRLNALGYGLEYVNFETAIRQHEGMKTKVLASYTTFDGLVIAVEKVVNIDDQSKKDENTPLIFKVRYDPSLLIKNSSQGSTDSSNNKNTNSIELKKDIDKAKVVADTRDEAKRLSSHLNLWAFNVANYVQKRYQKTIDDLIKTSKNAQTLKTP